MDTLAGPAAPVTLDDVARLSGVSRSTASRVINGQPGVRPDVRERVQRIADHVGFRPNRAAKQLASGRAEAVGLVLPSDDLRVDPYGASLTHAVGRAAARADLGLMLHLVPDEPGRTVHHILRDGLLAGLVISSVAVGRPWVDALLDSSMPTVLGCVSQPRLICDVRPSLQSSRLLSHRLRQSTITQRSTAASRASAAASSMGSSRVRQCAGRSA